MRKPQAGYHSFERLFADVRDALPGDMKVRVIHSWLPSNGLFKRLLNLLQVVFLRGGVLHITGDIQYLALGLWRRRVVLTIHDLGPLHKKIGLVRRIFRCLWYRWPIRIATVTTTISEAVKQELVDELGPDVAAKIRVIPNCVSPLFTYAPKAWPEPPRKPVVLMVGFKPNKNLGNMVQALRILPEEVDLRILAEVPALQRKRLERHGIPFQELLHLSDAEVVEAYREADLLFFASTYEGFGLPILEAQATGRPVLTSDRGAMREAAGEGALLVDPENVTDMRSAIRRLLTDPALRSELVERGRANVRKYNAEAVATQYAEVYLSARGRD